MSRVPQTHEGKCPRCGTMLQATTQKKLDWCKKNHACGGRADKKPYVNVEDSLKEVHKTLLKHEKIAYKVFKESEDKKRKEFFKLRDVYGGLIIKLEKHYPQLKEVRES